jgi:hypothetical protein
MLMTRHDCYQLACKFSISCLTMWANNVGHGAIWFPYVGPRSFGICRSLTSQDDPLVCDPDPQSADIRTI